MAVMDLFRSLTEKQQARLRNCQSLAEMQTVIKEEGIVLTEEHMEAICGYGWNGLGRKKKRSYLIETGLFGRFIVPSEEWKDLLQEAEEHESVIRRRFPSSSQQEAAACKLIIGENSALRNALLTADDTRSFLDSCLTLRGSFQDGKLRRLAREQARLLGYLADGAPLPDSAEAVLSLWETANRMEPRWADDLPAHFRTPDERVPCAHGKNPFVSAPVPVGYETSPPGGNTGSRLPFGGICAKARPAAGAGGVYRSLSAGSDSPVSGRQRAYRAVALQRNACRKIFSGNTHRVSVPDAREQTRRT